MSERTSFGRLQNWSGAAQTEPVSCVCGTSVIKYLIKGKKRMYTICDREGWGKCERNNIKVTELRGGGVAPSPQQKFPCSSWKTMLEQIFTLQPMESQCQSRNCSPWEYHTAEFFFLKAASCGKDPHWSSSWRILSHKKDPMLDHAGACGEEEVEERTRYGLTTVPIPHSSVLRVWRK